MWNITGNINIIPFHQWSIGLVTLSLCKTIQLSLALAKLFLPKETGWVFSGIQFTCRWWIAFSLRDTFYWEQNCILRCPGGKRAWSHEMNAFEVFSSTQFAKNAASVFYWEWRINVCSVIPKYCSLLLRAANVQFRPHAKSHLATYILKIYKIRQKMHGHPPFLALHVFII